MHPIGNRFVPSSCAKISLTLLSHSVPNTLRKHHFSLKRNSVLVVFCYVFCQLVFVCISYVLILNLGHALRTDRALHVLWLWMFTSLLHLREFFLNIVPHFMFILLKIDFFKIEIRLANFRWMWKIYRFELFEIEPITFFKKLIFSLENMQFLMPDSCLKAVCYILCFKQ